MIRQCKRCKKQFEPATSDTYYCDDCRIVLKRESVFKSAICAECGKQFIGGIAAKYCPECRRKKANEASAKCKKNKDKRKLGSTDYCQKCGAEYTVKSGKQKYCAECAAMALAEHNREVSQQRYHENNLKEKQAEQKRELKRESTVCPACGKPFTPNRANQMYCSAECRKIGGKQNKRYTKSGLYASNSEPKLKSNNKTGIRGVYWDNQINRYVVKIKIGEQFKRLGSYATIEEAEQAINEAKIAAQNEKGE